MKKPNKEDYHQNKTGENLMNGPYNYTRYAGDLVKFIDHIEADKKKQTKEFNEFIEHIAELLEIDCGAGLGYDGLQLTIDDFEEPINKLKSHIRDLQEAIDELNQEI